MDSVQNWRCVPIPGKIHNEEKVVPGCLAVVNGVKISPWFDLNATLLLTEVDISNLIAVCRYASADFSDVRDYIMAGGRGCGEHNVYGASYYGDNL